MIILREKIYTRFDDTDELKKKKDSDILAEGEKKPKIGIGEVLMRTAAGTAAGMGIGAAVGGINGKINKNKFTNKANNATNKWAANRYDKKAQAAGFWPGAKKGMLIGGALSGLTAGALALKERNKEAEDIEFYNKRLRYAKKQATRREKKDWENNMTNRDGYSY